MKSLCTFVFSKLWDKKYLRFSFDSPSYIRRVIYENHIEVKTGTGTGPVYLITDKKQRILQQNNAEIPNSRFVNSKFTPIGHKIVDTKQYAHFIVPTKMLRPTLPGFRKAVREVDHLHPFRCQQEGRHAHIRLAAYQHADHSVPSSILLWAGSAINGLPEDAPVAIAKTWQRWAN